MRNKIICPGKAKVVIVRDDRFWGYWGRMYDPYPEHPVKRIRMKCQICGRKVLSSVRVDHDGLELYHSIPPHKIKKWWKKTKKKSKQVRIR